MKKLVALFLWFCAATVLAQVCILGLSYFRGNFKGKSALQLVAMLNGIDIQGERLKKQLISARNTPTPTYQDVVDARAQASLELDSRETALVRFRDELLAIQAKLEGDQRRFDERRQAFEERLLALEKNVAAESLGELQRTIEILAPEQAKEQLLKMMKAGQTKDVVAIVKGLELSKRKKILAEFTDESKQEPEKLAEILSELRKGEPNASLIEKARQDAMGERS
jgi:hypothetical protein